jgi:predicted alpha/beta hydrolase family esterase
MVAIFSDSDPYVPLSQEGLFREKLGAKTMVLHARGHFSSSEGTTKLPEALAAVMEIVR